MTLLAFFMMKAASPGRRRPRRRRSRHLAAEAAEDDRDERAVHPLAHDVGEDGARGADQRPGDDQRGVAEGKSDARGRPARIGVEHRDDDRHVGAADRNDDEHAEQEREQRQEPERGVALAPHEPYDAQDEERRDHEVDEVAQRQQDRLAAHAAVELEEGDHRAGEGDGADRDPDRHFDEARLVDVADAADVEGARRIERSRRHQHRRHADERMERGDELRHRRHRHAPRDHRAGAPAQRQPEHHQRPGKEPGRPVRGERDHHRDQHADHAEDIAEAARFRVRQPAQRQDEQDAGDEIEQRDDILAHRRALISSFSDTSPTCAG
jgi:hypothetical protein